MLFFVAAILLIHPSVTLGLAGLALSAVLLGIHLWRRGGEPGPVTPTTKP